MELESVLPRYVYCVIRSGELGALKTRAIGDDNAQVRAVTSGGLAAVVSDSTASKYLQTRENMMAHTLVIEEVMRRHTLLPVRFGTVAPSENTVRERLLDRRRAELAALLDEMENRVELGLKAFWREDALFSEIVDENPAIRSLRDALRSRSQGGSYQDRMRLGEMVEEAVARKRDAEAEALMAGLRPLSYKWKANIPLGDRMILNAAFLVDTDRENEFDEAVRRLDGQNAHREAFKYVGPAPPYNFVNLLVRWED